MKLHPLSAALLFASAAGAASAAPGSPLDTLKAAKSVQVTETISVAGQTGTLKPAATLVITLSRPGMVASWSRASVGAKTPDMIMVSDGKTMTEFSPGNHQYRKSDAPPNGFGPAGLPALGDYPATSVATATTFDGKTALLYKTTRQVQGQPLTQKLWVDPQTHLPERQSTILGTGVTAKEVQRVDFTGWALDQTVAPSLFAFAPPAGAVEFKEPVLLAKGTAAPDFTAQDPSGKPVKLSDYKGQGRRAGLLGDLVRPLPAVPAAHQHCRAAVQGQERRLPGRERLGQAGRVQQMAARTQIL